MRDIIMIYGTVKFHNNELVVFNKRGFYEVSVKYLE